MAAGLVACTGCAPPLKVTINNDCAVVSVQRLGEYYTNITEVTLREARSGRVVWRAIASPGSSPKLHFVRLCPGTNAVAPEVWGDSDAYRYEVPGAGPSFELQRGVKYVVEVQGPKFLRRAHAEFAL